MKKLSNFLTFLIILFASAAFGQCTVTVTSTNNATCFGSNDGFAIVAGSGGTSPYDYVWTTSQTGTMASGLSAGTYCVTMTDNVGCTATTCVSITQPPQITATVNVTNPSVVGACDGSATIVVSGGTAPYSYVWSTGATTAIMTGLCAGIYSPTVVDANGCWLWSFPTVTITDPIGIYGNAYQDFNQNCAQDFIETNLANRRFILNPGNILLQTNSSGIWSIDSLPAGNYTITADTSSPIWELTCPPTQNFTVVVPDSSFLAASFGYSSNYPCSAPDISINAPFLRPGFSNQYVYVQACNTITASGGLNNAYAIVELDPLLTVNSGSMAYTSLGNNQYRVNLGNLSPGQCASFWLSCTLSASAVINSTLCMNAELYPVDSCVLDNIPNPYLGCTLPWDHSSLSVEVSCVNDSVRFVVYNTGVLGGGDMDCFAPVRVYLDGQYIVLDSIQLQGGDSIVYMFAGSGQTWRLEADQHPLHPGNSHPNATIENCGTGTWTPNLVNIFPMNDADPVVDIFCGLVRGSYDPNDKTGFPLGVGSSHDIKPNQDLEYVIRFQNTGTDTAFTIVIRDTLSMDFDIFSVESGVSSHNYDFRMYGPRVLEWTFNNIMLPDSNVNEAGSHGFITFKVKQKTNLPLGTVLENSAAIYFDFNAPIFTNTSWHTINNSIVLNTEKQFVADKKQIKIYPNPTTGIINVDISGSGSQEINILILDNLGRIVLQKQSNDIISSLNINHLSAGIYYVSINNGKEVMTQKVVKN